MSEKQQGKGKGPFGRWRRVSRRGRGDSESTWVEMEDLSSPLPDVLLQTQVSSPWTALPAPVVTSSSVPVSAIGFLRPL